jgi:hypothetical protein
MENWQGWYARGKSDFDTKGLPLTYEFAGRLCDELESRRIAVRKIFFGEHAVARSTAHVYARVLETRDGSKNSSRLLPLKLRCCPSVELTPHQGPSRLETFAARLRTRDADSSGKVAYIVVGHQPHLTDLARTLLKVGFLPGRNSLPGNSLPFGGSEAACIQLGYRSRLRWHRPRLLWLLTEEPAPLLDDLKDKIKSKYDVAKFFLGAFVVNTGLLLNASVWGHPQQGQEESAIASLLMYTAISSALVSLIFTAATLFSYDALMMPKDLWSEPGGESWLAKLLT